MEKRPGREESRAGGETAGAQMGLLMTLMITIIVHGVNALHGAFAHVKLAMLGAHE